jgi:hypothetical protein
MPSVNVIKLFSSSLSVRASLKNLPRTNTLAYICFSVIDREERFSAYSNIFEKGEEPTHRVVHRKAAPLK